VYITQQDAPHKDKIQLHFVMYEVEHSAVQREVLEPILFLLHINYLTENVQWAKLVLFTDHTNV
jgi:hypothetical protein